MPKKADVVPDYYAVLNVHPKAPEHVIKAAYHALMKVHHEDIGGAHSVAASINAGAEILLDAQKRKAYDADRRAQASSQIGNYHLVKQIGEGAFGYTYFAKHVLLDEPACLKQNINITPQDAELMAKEAKLLWRIHHHSLPSLRDFFNAPDGSSIIAMSYVDGLTIDKIVGAMQKQSPGAAIDPEHVSWIGQRLLNSLNYLHFHSVVHCDVKPNNIIVQPQAHNAVLVDYGFACLQPKRFTKPTGLTEAFAPPELLALRPPLPASDFYSLALTLMYALGGDVIKRQWPSDTPAPMRKYLDRFLQPNPLKRPTFEDTDLVKEWSEMRKTVFGRTTSDKELVIP